MKTIDKNTVPHTITRLRSLKRGEEIIYYKGNLETDISRCNPIKGGSGLDVGAATYQDLLRSIKNTAWSLAQEGKIKLLERPVQHDLGRVRYIEYVAIGMK